jgi:hypothetical protein
MSNESGTIHKITFAVLKGGKSAVLVTYPDEMEDALDGPYLDDNSIEGYPKEPGYYEASAVFWFNQGYCDGYPADGESDWGYKLTDIRPPESRVSEGPAPGVDRPAPDFEAYWAGRPEWHHLPVNLRDYARHIWDAAKAPAPAPLVWTRETPTR